jgi:Domain of unknown function (DUF4406)
MKKRIYVAGPYSADNVLDVLTNIRNGIRAAVKLTQNGYAPYCPWLDFMFHLLLRTDKQEELTVEDYRANSLAWLPACHAVLVLPGYETSRGTQAEIAEALKLNIPVFYDTYTIYQTLNKYEPAQNAKQ